MFVAGVRAAKAAKRRRKDKTLAAAATTAAAAAAASTVAAGADAGAGAVGNAVAVRANQTAAAAATAMQPTSTYFTTVDFGGAPAASVNGDPYLVGHVVPQSPSSTLLLPSTAGTVDYGMHSSCSIIGGSSGHDSENQGLVLGPGQSLRQSQRQSHDLFEGLDVIDDHDQAIFGGHAVEDLDDMDISFLPLLEPEENVRASTPPSRTRHRASVATRSSSAVLSASQRLPPPPPPPPAADWLKREQIALLKIQKENEAAAAYDAAVAAAAASAAAARERGMYPDGTFQTWLLELTTKARNVVVKEMGLTGDEKFQLITACRQHKQNKSKQKYYRNMSKKGPDLAKDAPAKCSVGGGGASSA